jgi:hypothetical protein
MQGLIEINNDSSKVVNENMHGLLMNNKIQNVHLLR